MGPEGAGQFRLGGGGWRAAERLALGAGAGVFCAGLDLQPNEAKAITNDRIGHAERQRI
jgi:hypothetical protein